jgi:hypothetical protein
LRPSPSSSTRPTAPRTGQNIAGYIRREILPALEQLRPQDGPGWMVAKVGPRGWSGAAAAGGSSGGVSAPLLGFQLVAPGVAGVQAVSPAAFVVMLPLAILVAKVDEIAGKILANPKWAVRWTKTTANIPLRALAAQLMDASIGWESVSNYLSDRREAVTAFKEKRAPKLTGE